MSSLDYLHSRHLDKEGTVEQNQPDEPVGLRLKYVGSGGVDKVEVDGGADELILNTNDANRTIDLTSGHSQFGDLVDTVNSYNEWDAKLIGVLRKYGLGGAGPLQNGTKSSSTIITGETVYDLLVDTSNVDRLGVRLTYDRGFQQYKNKDSHKVHLQEIVYDINFGSQKTNGFKIFEIDDTTETRIFQDTPADNSETTVNFASGRGKITAGEGNDLFIDLQDDGNMPDSGPYVRVIGELE